MLRLTITDDSLAYGSVRVLRRVVADANAAFLDDAARRRIARARLSRLEDSDNWPLWSATSIKLNGELCISVYSRTDLGRVALIHEGGAVV